MSKEAWGGIALALADKVRELGGEVRYKHKVTRILVHDGRASGVQVEVQRRSEEFLPADFVIANVTPWSLDQLLAEDSPPTLRRELTGRAVGWGAFVLYVGLAAHIVPANLPDHHQIITEMEGPLGEGRSVFLFTLARLGMRRARRKDSGP